MGNMRKRRGRGPETVDIWRDIHFHIHIRIYREIFGRYTGYKGYMGYMGEDQRPDIWLGKMRKSEEEEQRIGGVGGAGGAGEQKLHRTTFS